jgi:phosphoesterase RecJ-like protein
LEASLSVPLWIALATDTGWFRFANTSPWALSDASRLARHGIDVESLHQRICAELSPAQARVLGSVLSRVQVEWGGRFIWSVLPRAVYAAEGLGTSDLEGMIDSLKQVRGAEVIALITEVETERYKVSLRSTAQADVEACARHFGGGGHKKAAGFRFSGTSDRLLGELLGAMGAAAAVP